jgi:HSP20 family protein
MTLLRVKPENGRPRFSNLLENIFENDFPTFTNQEWLKNISPSVNIKENKDAFVLEVAAPGFAKDSFNVKVEDTLLTISAEAKEEKLNEGEKFTRKEFAHSSFKRTFTLPKTILQDKIVAAYENGILHITLPKVEEAKSKGPIEVKIA